MARWVLAVLIVFLTLTVASAEDYPYWLPGGFWHPRVRSLPWEPAAAVDPTQGFVSATVEVEDDCSVWEVNLLLRMNPETGYARIQDHTVIRTRKPAPGGDEVPARLCPSPSDAQFSP